MNNSVPTVSAQLHAEYQLSESKKTIRESAMVDIALTDSLNDIKDKLGNSIGRDAKSFELRDDLGGALLRPEQLVGLMLKHLNYLESESIDGAVVKLDKSNSVTLNVETLGALRGVETLCQTLVLAGKLKETLTFGTGKQKLTLTPQQVLEVLSEAHLRQLAFKSKRVKLVEAEQKKPVKTLDEAKKLVESL